ncbi:hypothetical protein, partial [Ligilactobacillus ruminis]|uniref:hypothetical protein n=1 Tax=Ligilactobacillus ruminis TaxID=1623 RepID=UPI001CDB57A6
APQVLERGFPPITKVTGFQPIYLSMNQTQLKKTWTSSPSQKKITFYNEGFTGSATCYLGLDSDFNPTS